jgi:hypothetical protein
MKMKENIYKISYKNGNSMNIKALSMILKDGKVYQTCKASPFDNPLPSVFDGTKINSIECIEQNILI